MSSTELAPRAYIDPALIARVILHGDLSQLSDAQRVSYYNAVCDSIGLNPLTQPLAYMKLSGKEVLYAKREATEQLRRLYNVSVQITGREVTEDCYVVTARATMPSGRQDENIGVVPIANLKGEARANAMMKAETKAKRRATLAICGLGMLDETEVGDIQIHAAPPKRIAAAPPTEAAKVSSPLGSTPAVTPETPDPPIAPSPEGLPPGFVYIEQVESAPTRNTNVAVFTVILSTGSEVITKNAWLATLARQYRDQRTPCRVVSHATRGGEAEILDELLIGDQTKTPIEGEIPF